MFRLDLTAYYSIRPEFFFFFLNKKKRKLAQYLLIFAFFISILDETLH